MGKREFQKDWALVEQVVVGHSYTAAVERLSFAIQVVAGGTGPISSECSLTVETGKGT
jgi:hypothetical protein